MEKKLKIAKGETVTVNGQEVTVTRVDATCKGILDGSCPVGQVKVTPMVRIYYKYPDGKKGHTVAVVNKEIEVVLG